ncbi:hypothetical protein BV22DRAFT_1006969 [Leucogyrophana mollusca]|uniref:Uncharacterized protein n=1 Tax=Leucogyrophana mollusca TaxID=85980 RepID=A0ACB8BQI0_9AGAM|nr:hypothetical protein BV22DRAFT_1006969 [Leucogyrophana mollusca]
MTAFFVVCLVSLHRCLRSSRFDLPKRRRTIYHLLYISVLYILGTLYLTLPSRGVVLEYVDRRNLPGGPLAYAGMIARDPFAHIGSVCCMFANWMSDCLVLCRVVVLYHGTRYRGWAVVFAFMMFFGVVVTGILLLVHSFTANQPYYSQYATQHVFLYYAFTLSLSVVSTVLVISRVYVHRKQLRKDVGPGQGSPWANIALTTIESSGLYLLWQCIFLVLYAIHSPMQYFFLTSLCQVQIISSFLVIFNVSRGKAWTRKPDPAALSALWFPPNPTRSPKSSVSGATSSPSANAAFSGRGMGAIPANLRPPAVLHIH